MPNQIKSIILGLEILNQRLTNREFFSNGHNNLKRFENLTDNVHMNVVFRRYEFADVPVCEFFC